MTGPTTMLAEAIVAASVLNRALERCDKANDRDERTVDGPGLVYLLFCRWLWEDYALAETARLGAAGTKAKAARPDRVCAPEVLRDMTFDVFVARMLELEAATLDEFLANVEDAFDKEIVPIFEGYFKSYFELTKPRTPRP